MHWLCGNSQHKMKRVTFVSLTCALQKSLNRWFKMVLFHRKCICYMHNCIQLYTLYQFINYAAFNLFEFSICWGDRDCIKIKCYLTIFLTINWYIPTSFWAASACSTSDISLLFSRSLVAGVRWSSSRSGIFLVKKAWHWLRLTTLLVAYNIIVIQYIRKIHISWFCHLHEDLILECGSKVFF